MRTLVTIGGIVVLLAVVVFITGRARRRRGIHDGIRPHAGLHAGPGTDELRATAALALVATDDAVRTSEQELGFVTARSGDRAAAPLLTALESARAELGTAFALQQSLDDGTAHGITAHGHLTEIAAHCAAASRLLDEQAADFDRLQDIEARAPQLLAEVDAHVAQQSARVDRSRQILGQVAGKYTASAVDAVRTSPDEAVERLEFAADCLATARRQLATGQSAAAARFLQTAEASADQATDLLGGIERRQAQLTQAASVLPGALREIDAEIGEATEALANRPGGESTSLVTRAQAAAAAVRAQQAAGPFDAIAALREIQLADSALDRALAGVRGESAKRERARPVLDEAMLVARSSVTAAEDFVETNRGRVAVTARTRLAEAHRHFRRAIGRLQDDPEGALAEALDADTLAQAARSLAEFDVGAGQPAGSGQHADAGVRSGIVIGNSDGAYGPGSFGGTATRGRHIGSGLRYDTSLIRESHVQAGHHRPCHAAGEG